MLFFCRQKKNFAHVNVGYCLLISLMFHLSRLSIAFDLLKVLMTLSCQAGNSICWRSALQVLEFAFSFWSLTAKMNEFS